MSGGTLAKLAAGAADLYGTALSLAVREMRSRERSDAGEGDEMPARETRCQDAGERDKMWEREMRCRRER